MNKINVCIVFGGKSNEHEVSMHSARSIYKALDKNKYNVSLLGITKEGSMTFLSHQKLTELQNVTSAPSLPERESNQIRWLSKLETITNSFNADKNIDVFFPIIHGTNGEDGTLQGFFEMLGIPYIGAGVLGSAVGMDKDVMKRLLQQAGIRTCRFLIITKSEYTDKQVINKKIEDFVPSVGYPVFIKPANMGSSIGVTKAHNTEQLHSAIAEAFKYDRKVLIEEYIQGDEIEIALLGNEEPVASLPGKVLPNHEFYTYEDKYFEEGASFEIPAKLPDEKVKEIQQTAINVYKTLECSGMARIDFFLKPDGELLVNEINTLPGFTSTSVYPKLWEASGISYAKLIDKLIMLALEK